MVLNKLGRSLDAEWVIALVARDEQGIGAETLAIPQRGGAPVRICALACETNWSPDGRFLYISLQGGSLGPRAGRTLAIPVPPGRALPELPVDGIPFDSDWTGPPGTRVIERIDLVPGLDPSSYVFVKTDFQRNLFRIPLR